MRRMTRRFRTTLAMVGVVATVAWFGLTSGIAQAHERSVFLRPPRGLTQAARERRVADSATVHALLQAARGANAVMCEMAANVADGRSGWSSSSDGGFRVGGSSDPATRDVVTWVNHREVDPAAVPLLRVALTDADWCVRRFAAPLLAHVKHASANQAMLDALTASDAGTREMGALALGLAESRGSVQPLVARLRDDAPRVRATAAWALGEMERREAVRPLIDALGDSAAIVRESAARALGEIEDAAAVAPLTDLLKSDGDAAVRRAAARALGEIIG